MDIPTLAGAVYSIVASPLLVLGLCCTAFYVVGLCFYLLWSVAACLIFRDADLWTKLLPEKDVWKGGRTAWVTGASSGIGLSLCKQLAQRRCRLVMSSKRMEDLETAKQLVIEACASKGVQVRPAADFLLLPFDITDAEAAKQATQRAAEWTDGRIDFLFNNAGIMMRGLFCSYPTVERLILVDLLAHIRLTTLLIPLFVKNKFGHIVFTNCLFSKIIPCGIMPYCVAKAGLMSYATALSRELMGSHNNIHVTSAVLGMVKTGVCSRALGSEGQPFAQGSAWMHPRIAEAQSPDYVAKMMLRATSNRLREAWIADGVYLFLLYLQHYTPAVANWLLDLRTEAHMAEVQEEARELEEIAQRVKS